jgi:hypothetical protein
MIERWANVPRPIIVVVLATAFLLVGGLTRPPVAAADSTAPVVRQKTFFSLQAKDGRLLLVVRSFGRPFAIDASKFSFTASRYGGGARLPLDVTLGPATVARTAATAVRGYNVGLHMVVTDPQPAVQDSTMALEFGSARGLAGMYDVQLHVAPGFATTEDGAALKIPRAEPFHEPWHFLLWWPDHTDSAASLRAIQTRYAGHNVYGYGGILVGCPNAFSGYDFSTPVRVRDVLRDDGRIQEIWLGTTVAGGNDAAPHFYAVDPLRVLLGRPEGKPFFTGGTSIQPTEQCPAIVLADWQLDLTLSMAAPSIAPEERPFDFLRVGMSRDEVAWRFGYPHQFADLQTLSQAAKWDYDSDPYDSFWIAFSNDRVSAFQKPSGGP